MRAGLGFGEVDSRLALLCSPVLPGVLTGSSSLLHVGLRKEAAGNGDSGTAVGRPALPLRQPAIVLAPGNSVFAVVGLVLRGLRAMLLNLPKAGTLCTVPHVVVSPPPAIKVSCCYYMTVILLVL